MTITENSEKNFISKFIIEPINNSIYGLRQVTKKIGYLEAIDGLFLRGIEEPLMLKLLTSNYQFEISGTENLKQHMENGCLLISNFQSAIDPLISGVSVMHITKKIPNHVLPLKLGVDSPIMNLVRMNQTIFSRTSGLEEETIEECLIALEQRKIIFFYPEMQPNLGNGAFLPFNPGYIQVAFESKCPTIPVAIFGTDRVFGPKMKIPAMKGNIKIRFGKPLFYKNLFKDVISLDFRLLEKVNKKIQRKVKNLWSDIWAEEEDKKKER
ncbi:lysophospholipid acyltransferase family protein [Candidatus Harpocratesius sp.]